MKAVTCTNAKFEVTDVPTPSPGPGHLLLEVLRCGICGSDLHARHHADELADVTAEVGYDGIFRSSDSVVLGHEFVGELIEHGPRTRKTIREGARVVAMPLLRRDGSVHATGLSVAAPGGYAEQLLVDEALAFEVPNGLAVIAMLKATGIRTVVASDFSPGRRALATACGADVVVDPAADSPFTAVTDRGHLATAPDVFNLATDAMDKLRRVPMWHQVYRAAEAVGAAKPKHPVVFECVGVPGMIDRLISDAPFFTRMVVVGVCMEADRMRPAMAINKEADLRFVLGYTPLEFRDTLHLLAEGKVQAKPVITGRVGLDGVDSAFTALGDPEAHAKILIDPKSPATQPESVR